MNKEKIDKFWASRTKIEDPRLATNYRQDGRLSYDIKFVSKFLPQNAKILDLGAGTCTLSSTFLEQVDEIIAVDKFAEFLAKAPEHPRLKKVCDNVANFLVNKKFEIILLFGVVNFLTAKEELAVYKSCQAMLSDKGVLLVKNQCGIEKEILIDNYSEELNEHYHARYPFLADQIHSLSKFFKVDTIDVYPSTLNRWSNTHFYGFVCQKSDS